MRTFRSTRLAAAILATASLALLPAAARADDISTRSLAQQMSDFESALLASCNGPVANLLPQAQQCSFSPMSKPFADTRGDVGVTVPVDPDYVLGAGPTDRGSPAPLTASDLANATTADPSREYLTTGPPIQLTQWYFNCSNSQVVGSYSYQHKDQTTITESTTITRSVEVAAAPLGVGASVTASGWFSAGHTWDVATWTGAAGGDNLLRWNAGWADTHPVYAITDGYAKVVMANAATAPDGTTSNVWWVHQIYSAEASQQTAINWGLPNASSLEAPAVHTRALTPTEVVNCLNDGYGGAPPLTNQIVAATKGSNGQPQCVTMTSGTGGGVQPILADCASDTGRDAAASTDLVGRQQFVDVPREPESPSSRYVIENLATRSCLAVGSPGNANASLTLSGDTQCGDTQGLEDWRLSSQSGLATWENDGTGDYLTAGTNGAITVTSGVPTAVLTLQWGRSTADVLGTP